MQIEIKGGPELQARLNKLTSSLKTATLEGAVLAGAAPILMAAKSFAPVDTGALRASLHIQIVARSAEKVTASVGTNLVYARQREYGGVIVPKRARLLAWQSPDGGWRFARRVYQRPQPYMRPAFDTQKAAAQAAAIHYLLRATGLS